MQENFEKNLEIAIFIRTVRGILGYSQKVFAEKMGLPQSTITRAEVMETDIRYSDFHKILEAMAKYGIEYHEYQRPMTFQIHEQVFDLVIKQIENKKQIKELKQNAP